MLKEGLHIAISGNTVFWPLQERAGDAGLQGARVSAARDRVVPGRAGGADGAGRPHLAPHPPPRRLALLPPRHAEQEGTGKDYWELFLDRIMHLGFGRNILLNI